MNTRKVCANCLEVRGTQQPIVVLVIGAIPVTIPGHCAVCDTDTIVYLEQGPEQARLHLERHTL